MKGERIAAGKRQAIRSLRGERTARELAHDFGVSERSVIRIWAESAGEDMAKDIAGDEKESLRAAGHRCARDPEGVGALMAAHYLRLLERREYYAAMADAYPDNCAWGHLEAKYDRLIAEELKTMGRWQAMDSWR